MREKCHHKVWITFLVCGRWELKPWPPASELTTVPARPQPVTVVGDGLKRVFEPLAADHRSEAEKTNFCRTYFPNHDDDSPFKATFSLSLSHSLSLFLSFSLFLMIHASAMKLFNFPGRKLYCSSDPPKSGKRRVVIRRRSSRVDKSGLQLFLFFFFFSGRKSRSWDIHNSTTTTTTTTMTTTTTTATTHFFPSGMGATNWLTHTHR